MKILLLSRSPDPYTSMNQAMIAGAAGLLLAPVAEAGYVYAMANPLKTIAGIGISNDILNPSLPPATPIGQAYWMYDHRDGVPK